MSSVEAVHRPEGPQQGVLDQVLGVDGTAGDRERNPQQDVHLGKDVLREGVPTPVVRGYLRLFHRAGNPAGIRAIPGNPNRARRVPGAMSSWRHHRLRRLVQAYLDDELHHEPARRAAAHLRTCFDCNTDAETSRLVRHSLRRLAARAGPQLVELRLRHYGEDLVRRG